eukprot:3685707-Pyramimonas_sp.AAC.1
MQFVDWCPTGFKCGIVAEPMQPGGQPPYDQRVHSKRAEGGATCSPDIYGARLFCATGLAHRTS